MTLSEVLEGRASLRVALALGLGIALVGALWVTPRAIRKLRGAGIVGRDQHKPGRPEIPEMGGLAVFLAFNAGTFAILGLARISAADETLIVASLVVAAGACITGVLDDLVELRQRFKAFIPFAFAAPLALYAPSTVVHLPHFGDVDFGLAYSLLLVPLGVACASNGFNMLEGFNGLGAGLGIILAGAISVMAILTQNLTGLFLLFPLIGALVGFLWFNAFPARIFPGDTMTLLVGAVLACAAIVSHLEFWGVLLFVPHILEFLLKAKGSFKAENFASRLDGDKLLYEGKNESLTHLVMKTGRLNESGLVLRVWLLETVYAGAVLVAFVLVERPSV